MRTVVGRVHDNCIVRDTELIELVEQVTHDAIMLDHAIGIFGQGGQPRCAAVLFLDVGPEVHPGGIHPDKERCSGFDLTLHEVDGRGGGFLIDRFHTLLGQRAGILDLAIGRSADDAARAKAFAELFILRIVEVLRFFLGIQVIEVAEEFVKAMFGGQMFVAVAEVVLAELPCRIAVIFQGRSDRDIDCLHTGLRARQTDL